MTAMMVLFLTAMAVTIAAVTIKVDGPADQRAKEIADVCERIKDNLKDVQSISVDCADNRISFGEVGRFKTNDYRLPKGANEALAKLVPVVLEVADEGVGKKWMKQVVVEGYTDRVGGYLYNLHLSLLRSEWVLCLLMDPRKNMDLNLSATDLRRVRELFLAGGVSFNGQQDSDDASRRVELRIQYYGLKKCDRNSEGCESGEPDRQQSPAQGTAGLESADMCQL